MVGVDGVAAVGGLVNTGVGVEPPADRRRMRRVNIGVQAGDCVADRLGADASRTGLADDAVDDGLDRKSVV